MASRDTRLSAMFHELQTVSLSTRFDILERIGMCSYIYIYIIHTIQIQGTTMDDLTVYITSALTSSERKISPNWSIETFQKKLELITGIPPLDQKICVYPRMDSNERKELILSNVHSLAEVDIVPFGRIHIDNTNPDSQIDELEKILDEDRQNPKNEDYEGKFKLSEAKYGELSNTVLKYMKDNKVGKFDPDLKAKELKSSDEILSRLKLNDRCRISNDRIGTIKYIGKVPEINEIDTWIGVSLDAPNGKNDGSIKGIRYFECGINHGAFVKPLVVELGNFPDPRASTEEDSDEEL